MSQSVSKIPSDKEINILLLGETGAGKSTTLNALANYLKYGGDFSEAVASVNNLEEVIYSQFTLRHPETGAEMTIESGSKNANERSEFGLSATKAPFGYTFKFGEYLLRVIDTPGIGDTAGTQEDNQNFDQILLFLQHHKKLNAILFIVKGNESRKNVFFRYCITQLLLHLHKSVSDNIVFCFTYSRNSMYGPGEGFTTLKSFLENEINEVNLHLVPGKNCFFIDNESYRFLVAKRQNYPFKDNIARGYQNSWEESVEQIELLLRTVIALPPHNLTKTVSLNAARKIILELAQPMIQMQKQIKLNIEQIQQQQQSISASRSDEDKLAGLLKLEFWDLRSKSLNYPSTVCASRSCIERVNVNGTEKLFYKTRCHENCWCMFVQENMTNQPMLMICSAMNRNPFKLVTLSTECTKCGCSSREHMHISCEYIKEKKTVIDEAVQKQINSTKDTIEQLKQAVDASEKFVKEYEDELKTIQDVSAKFAYMLSCNSYFTHNKFFEEYIQNLIDEENKKANPNVEPLKRIKTEHERSVRILKDAIDREQTSTVQLEDIPRLKQQLLSLKHNGPNFRQILETNQRAMERKFKPQEKEVLNVPKRSSGKFGNLFY